MPYQVNMDQINGLLVKIMEHKIAGVTSASVAYSAFAKRTQFGFEYLGISDPSRFTVDRIHQNKTVRRVSRVLLDAETVPYVPKLFNALNAPRQIMVSSHCS
jgi:hypothetical protein